jgi:hypothetical protein
MMEEEKSCDPSDAIARAKSAYRLVPVPDNKRAPQYQFFALLHISNVELVEELKNEKVHNMDQVEAKMQNPKCFVCRLCWADPGKSLIESIRTVTTTNALSHIKNATHEADPGVKAMVCGIAATKAAKEAAKSAKRPLDVDETSTSTSTSRKTTKASGSRQTKLTEGNTVYKEGQKVCEKAVEQRNTLHYLLTLFLINNCLADRIVECPHLRNLITFLVYEAPQLGKYDRDKLHLGKRKYVQLGFGQLGAYFDKVRRERFRMSRNNPAPTHSCSSFFRNR